MITMKAHPTKRRRAQQPESESGIALITVLFLLITMTILGLTMVATVNSDMMINGYYGNSRAAYYAADSGLNIARQYLSDQLQNQVVTTACLGWGPTAVAGCTADPLSGSASTTALANLRQTFGGAYSSSNLNVATTPSAASWPSAFIIQDSTACASSFAAATGSPIKTPSPLNANLTGTYTYSFNYVICSTGTAASTSLQRASVKESGTLLLVIQAQDTPPPSFAGYGQFVTNQASCPGAYLTPGTYTGPTFTDGTWSLGNTGPYIFTGKLSQVQPDIDYYVGSKCTASTSSSFPGISATFQAGLQLNAPAITPPANSYSQAWAVLDGLGTGEGTGSPTNANLNAVLKNVSATVYPSGGATTGVYLPYYSNGSGGYNFGYLNNGVPAQSGGIYVQGNASIILSATTDTSGNPTQTYSITQGTTVTTIVTNPTTNTTTFSSGGTTQTISGIPENLASVPGEASPGTMLYVNGTITGLSGPAAPGTSNMNANEYTAAAIQNNSMVTISGAGDIDITGNILYATEPVTKTPADTLLLNQGTSSSNQVLGIYTANGSIYLNSPYSDQDLETDASMAAIGSSTTCGTGTCGFKSSDTINTWNNVGGQIQSNEFVCTITTANTYYDQRFSAWSNFFPPWFPSTSTGGTSYTPHAPQVTPTQQRTSWAWVAAQ